jgi:hypothetical protein
LVPKTNASASWATGAYRFAPKREMVTMSHMTSHRHYVTLNAQILTYFGADRMRYWSSHSVFWCPRSESNRQHAGFESASSANWDTRAKLVLVVLLRWYNQENLDRPIAARRRLKTLGYNHPNSNTYGVTHWFSGR